jgi:hypothetical protein
MGVASTVVSATTSRGSAEDEGSAERQLARAGTDVDGLGVRGDDPVLADGVPVGDVAAGDVHGEGRAGAGGDVAHLLEAAEHDLGVVGSAEGNVDLGDLVAGVLAAGVGHGGRDGEEDVVEALVATGGNG